MSQRDQGVHQTEISRHKVIIIGAGASGLQCASTLLNAGVHDILLLEARNRIGGRVWTTQETKKRRRMKEKKNVDSGCSQQNDAEGRDNEENVSFCRDHGAAWIHGIGTEETQVNPMVKLLLNRVCPDDNDGSFSSTKKIPLEKRIEQFAAPIFDGNPWTRPGEFVQAVIDFALLHLLAKAIRK